MDFKRLDDIARSIMIGRRAQNERELGHVYYHGVRTMRSVIELRMRITDDASHDDLLRAAALFHDCGKALEPHSRSGVALVGEFLKDELTPDELLEVQRLILSHDDRGDAGADMWLKLLQDADLLDHYGSMEVWLNFNFSARYERPVSSSVEFWQSEYSKQADGHRRLINFDLTRRIFDEKVAFTYDFARRLAIEAAGGFVGLD